MAVYKHSLAMAIKYIFVSLVSQSPKTRLYQKNKKTKTGFASKYRFTNLNPFMIEPACVTYVTPDKTEHEAVVYLDGRV